METQNWLLVAVFCLLSFSRRTCAYNITETLDSYSDYSQFNQLLTRTRLDSEINKEGTATVLVVNNGAAGSLSGQPKETIEAVLRLHVILDFLNKDKISNLKPSTAFTNAYQKTGQAQGNQGATNMTKTGSSNNNQIMFGNGKQNAKLTVSLQKIVFADDPLSIIEVTGLIQPDWVFNIKASAPKKAPSQSPSDAPAPSKRHRKEAPESAESPEVASPPEPESDAESSDASPAPAPGGAKSAASPSSSSAPVAAALASLVGLLAFTMGL